MQKLTFAPGLMEALGLRAKPVEAARPLRQEQPQIDPALKRYRRRRQVAHRRARTQRRINMANGSRKGVK